MSDIKRMINVYRCFNPEGNYTARYKFKGQLNVIKNAMVPKTVIIGDLNIIMIRYLMTIMHIRTCLMISMKCWLDSI